FRAGKSWCVRCESFSFATELARQQIELPLEFRGAVAQTNTCRVCHSCRLKSPTPNFFAFDQIPLAIAPHQKLTLGSFRQRNGMGPRHLEFGRFRGRVACV